MGHPCFTHPSSRLLWEASRPALYFDSNAANDSGDGSIGNPYQQFTAARLVLGTRHLIKRGSRYTWTGTNGIAVPTGSQWLPIIIDAYGSGPLPFFDVTACNFGFRLAQDATDIRIRNIEVYGPNNSVANAYAISHAAPTNATTFAQVKARIVIENCIIHDVAGDKVTDANGIKLYGGENDVRNNIIYNIDTDGIWFHGYWGHFQGNRVFRVAKDGRIAGDCIQAGADSSASVVDANWLDHSSAGGSGDGKQCIYFQEITSISTGVVISRNRCYGYEYLGNSHTPIYCGAINSIVKNNWARDGVVTINMTGPGGICFGNVVYNSASRGIEVSNSTVQVFNNYIVCDGPQTGQTNGVGIRHLNSTDTGNSVGNNVLVGWSNGVQLAATGCTENKDGFINCTTKYRLGGTPTTPNNEVTIAATDFNSDYFPKTGSAPVAVGQVKGFTGFFNPPSIGAKEVIRQRSARS